MVLADEGHEAFCQSDESDAQCTLVDYGFDGIVRIQFVGTDPQTLHQQGELLREGGLLETEAVVELSCRDVEHVVELGEEGGDALLLVIDAHAFDGQTDDVDGGEGEVPAPHTGLGSETVLEDAGATAHGGHLMEVALGIVGTPLIGLVEGGIEVQEVREEPSCRHLTGQLVEVVVRILGQVVHSSLLLPDLDGEDGGLTVAHTLVGALQDLAHDASSLCRGVGAVVDAGEHHLVTAARVDGVHVMDEGLHRLMHAAHRFVHGMLQHTVVACQSV